MIGYTCIGTNDLEKAADFYDQLLSLLGAKPFFKNGSRGWMGGEP
jgi:catechol 2,3-dioxygenase-like lactoylglutathione lyase family enzyme